MTKSMPSLYPTRPRRAPIRPSPPPAGPRRRTLVPLALLAFQLMVALWALSVPPSPAAAKEKQGDSTPSGLVRDWKEHPAIVELDAPQDLYALGDVHGDYDRLVELLSSAKLIASPAPPTRPRTPAGRAGRRSWSAPAT